MRFSVLIVAVIALFVNAGTVLVQPAVADDAATCDNASGDEAIAACTRVIQNRGTSTKNRALAYNNRGVEYGAKGDHDRAISDFSEAIRLDPKYAVAYANRGVAYEAKGRSEER